MASLQHLPEEYTTVLSVLQDQARCRPFRTIAAVIAEELGQPVDQLFAEFEETPIAAASLAQVHRALLKDGREVAVKVQYPGLERQVETDLRTMALLSSAVAWAFPDYQFQWIVPEFQENLQQQLGNQLPSCPYPASPPQPLQLELDLGGGRLCARGCQRGAHGGQLQTQAPAAHSRHRVGRQRMEDGGWGTEGELSWEVGVVGARA